MPICPVCKRPVKPYTGVKVKDASGRWHHFHSGACIKTWRRGQGPGRLAGQRLCLGTPRVYAAPKHLGGWYVYEDGKIVLTFDNAQEATVAAEALAAGFSLVEAREAGEAEAARQHRLAKEMHGPRSLGVLPPRASADPTQPGMRRLDDVINGGDPFPVVRDFYASRGISRQKWLKALDTLSRYDLQQLARIANDYGTAAGIELKDAAVDLPRARSP